MATKRKTSSRRRTSISKRSSGERELVKGRNAAFAKRTVEGRLKEMAERGRSLAGDRRRKATTKAKRDQGDRGDRVAA